MADLNARTDSFIALLLDVSGRARVTDLQALPPAEAAEALRQYAAVHPERSVVFDGDSLVPAAGAVVAPAPPAAPAADDGMFEFGPAPVAPAVPAVAVAPEPQAVAAGFGSEFPPAPAPVAAAVDAAPQAAAPFGGAVPGVPAPESFEPRDDSLPATADFLDLPPLEGGSNGAASAPRVPLYWWVLAVLLGWLGGLVGWLVLRRANPKGARAVLLTGVVVTVLSAVLAAAAVFFGAAAFLGLAPVERIESVPVPVAVPTTEAAPATATAPGTEATSTP